MTQEQNQQQQQQVREAAELAAHFDVTVEQAREMQFSEGQTLIWTEAFKLDSWLILMKPSDNPQQPEPFFGNVDGHGWAFLFTDPMHAQVFGRNNNLVTGGGNVLIAKMKVEAMIAWLEEIGQSGLYGVRFNEGENGWFTPVDSLRAMKEYVEMAARQGGETE
ncbi:hypothetical protein [Saccharibacillus kuerlensis]|uniref:Uncharacterized protein n=1 Tax=Saccharibacillus kuerlensis TaxID=459527 RepID=A0ABQ2L0J1_9BACL|nr:hypothetical protein [Saccharibacillus kuerlensis]GGN98760.1 hypothetical protein GCM10010969_18210 [Saccharibacillus kuerlensis]